jgi:precorrin-2 methylase
MSIEKIVVYIITASLLFLAVYLQSSFVAGAAVCLIAVEYAKDILLRLQENQKVLALEADLEKAKNYVVSLEKRVTELEKDVLSAVNRVKETLGETF